MDFTLLKKTIDSRLESILQTELIKHQSNKIISNNIQDFLRLSKGGKRIRAILVIIGSQLKGKKKVDDNIIDLAVAVELMQTAILIHDDIIDQADKRRGEVTINHKYSMLGVPKAICVGDYGFFLTYQIINQLNIEDKIKNNLNIIMTRMMYNTVLGEILDVELPHQPNPTQADLNSIYINKTAWYTAIGPLLLGASFINIPKELETEIINFGTNLGIAFQIKDDLISISNQTDKSSNSDILEGKITEMYLYTKNNKKEDIIGYGDPSISDQVISNIKNQFKNNGAIKYANDQVDYYSKEALEILQVMNINDNIKEDLIKLVNVLLTRKK